MKGEFKTICRRGFPEKFFVLFTFAVLVATTTLCMCFEGQAKTEDQDAVAAKENADYALAESLIRSIGGNALAVAFSNLTSSTAEEQVALWKLSELDTANQNVRKQVIDIWLHTPESVVGGAC